MCVVVGGVDVVLLLLLGAAAQFQFPLMPSGPARKFAHHIKKDPGSNYVLLPFSRWQLGRLLDVNHLPHNRAVITSRPLSQP